MKKPQLGSIAWVSLYEDGVTKQEALKGVSVAVKYVGNRKANEWRSLLGKHHVESVSMLEKLRKGKRREEVPELWELKAHPDSLKGIEKLLDQVLDEAVAGIDGIEGVNKEDKEVACELVKELDANEGLVLVNKCVELQSLSHAERFSL